MSSASLSSKSMLQIKKRINHCTTHYKKGQQDATKGIWLKARRSKIGEDTSLSGFVGINPRCQGHNWGLLGSNKLKWSPQFILHTYTGNHPHKTTESVYTLISRLECYSSFEMWNHRWNARICKQFKWFRIFSFAKRSCVKEAGLDFQS